MGLGPEMAKLQQWEGQEAAIKKKKKKKKTKKEREKNGESEIGDESEAGCWIKFRLMRSCISSRSKVDTSTSSSSTHCGNLGCLHFCLIAKISSFRSLYCTMQLILWWKVRKVACFLV